MASRVQTANTADSSSATLAFGSNVASGNLLIVFLRVSTGDGTPTGITDTVGSSYTQIGSTISISGGTGYLYYARAAAAGANTVTIGGGAIARILIEEVSGLTTPTLDVTAQTTGTSSAAASGSITAAASTWVFAGLVLSSYPSVGVTAGSGWTTLNLADGNKYGGEDRDFTAGGSVNGQFTLPESNTWGAIVASFKSSGGTTNTKVMTDTLVMADAKLTAVYRVRQMSDTLTASDGFADWLRRVRAQTDSITLSDGDTYRFTIITATDTLDVVDGIVKVLSGNGVVYAKVLSDTLTIIDDAGNRWTRRITQLTDAVGLSDQVVRAVRRMRLLGDNVEFSDGTVKIQRFTRSLDESIEISDERISTLYLDQISGTVFVFGAASPPFRFGGN